MQRRNRGLKSSLEIEEQLKNFWYPVEFVAVSVQEGCRGGARWGGGGKRLTWGLRGSETQLFYGLVLEFARGRC